MNLVLLVIIPIALSSFFLFSRAYGDGLASEILSPELIGNTNVTLSVGIIPIQNGNNQTGTTLNLILMDTSSRKPIPNATLDISAFKKQGLVFDHVFKSDTGDFVLHFYPQDSGIVTYNETTDQDYENSTGNSGNYEINGPVFHTGGLYKFKIDVLTIGSYSNQANRTYLAGISIPEYDNLTINDPNYGAQHLQIVAYYDQLQNITYDGSRKFINFSMPFDWSYQNLRQLTVVHQEIRIPKTLGDFIVTKYDAYVNNIRIPDKLLSIDDYSLDAYRTVHIILFRPDVEEIYSEQDNPNQVMNFAIRPSSEVSFPIIHFTRNAQYQVALSWTPATITTGSSVQFKFKLIDPYRPNSTLDSIPYDFLVLDKKDHVMFNHNGTTKNSGDSITVPIPSTYTGPVTISLDNLDNNTYANAQFPTNVVSLSRAPEFPYALMFFGFAFALLIPVGILSNSWLQMGAKAS